MLTVTDYNQQTQEVPLCRLSETLKASEGAARMSCSVENADWFGGYFIQVKTSDSVVVYPKGCFEYLKKWPSSAVLVYCFLNSKPI